MINQCDFARVPIAVPFMARKLRKSGAARSPCDSARAAKNRRAHCRSSPADIRTEFNDSVVKTNAAHYEDKVAKNMGSGATKHGLAAQRRNWSAAGAAINRAIESTSRVTSAEFFRQVAPLIFRVFPSGCASGVAKYYEI